MLLCFWCDTEQPRTLRADLVSDGSPNVRYAPCAACEGEMASGVALVEVSDDEVATAQVGLHLGDGRIVYPTGLWAVVTQEFMKEFQAELGDMAGRYGFCMVTKEIWTLMGLER